MPVRSWPLSGDILQNVTNQFSRHCRKNSLTAGCSLLRISLPADSIADMLVQQDLFDVYRIRSAEKRKHVPGGIFGMRGVRSRDIAAIFFSTRHGCVPGHYCSYRFLRSPNSMVGSSHRSATTARSWRSSLRCSYSLQRITATRLSCSSTMACGDLADPIPLGPDPL